MNKLQRIKSTDLTVLRSILNDETDSNLVTLTDVNHEESTNENLSTHSNDVDVQKCENENCKNIKNEKPSLTSKSFTPDKPFIITRIESKHKSNIANKVSSKQKSSINLYSSHNELPVYKSIHYQSIIEKENRLEKKYQKLYKVLNRDILMKTVSLCDQYINDGRQLVQNSLATSRIVSSFIEDMSNSQDRKFKHSQDAPLANMNLDLEPTLSFFENPDRSFGLLSENSFIKTHRSVSVPPSDSKETRTKHMLDSEEPFIRRWLERKNWQLNLEKQIKREEDKIENAISIGAIAVQERRKAEADEAFKKWLARKKIHAEKRDDDLDGFADGSDDSEVGLAQAGRQPKPSSSKSRRQTKFLLRPKSSATFAIHNNTKIKVMGQPVSLVSSETSRLSTHVDYSKPLRKPDLMPLRPQTAVPQSRKKDVLSVSQPIFQKQVKKKHKVKKTRPASSTRKNRDLKIDAEKENLEFSNLETSEILKCGQRNDKPNDNQDIKFKDYRCSLLSTKSGNKNVLLEDTVTNSSNEISEDLSNFSDEDIQ